MSKHLKKNVKRFDKDVQSNNGYMYTTNSVFSSKVANDRISRCIIAFIKFNKYKTIIDAGCGDGVYTQEIRNAFPKAIIEAFDPAVNAVEIAKKNYPSIKFYPGDLLDKKSLPSRKFDVAIIRGVLHHMSDQSLAIKNAFTLAKEVIIMEPNGNNPILKIIEKTSRYHIEHEEQSFSIFKFKEWFRDANAEITELKYIGFVPFFCPTILAKVIYFFQPIFEKIPLVNRFLSAQIMIRAKKAHDR